MEKRTLREEIFFKGTGVHTGEDVEICLLPSASGEIVFRRTDLKGLELRLDPKNIESMNCSSLVTPDGRIQTIEHLMATLYMFGVDSLTIELSGSEIPIMDGSAAAFAQAVQAVGVQPVPGKKRSIRILEQVIVHDRGASVLCYPDSEFRVSYFIEFPHPAIQKQELSLALTLDNFISGIAPARTFGFLKDVEYLKSQGLALGGSLENAIVLDDEKVMNPPLRFPDEFVRHKILDLVGDFALVGYPLIGHFSAHKAGHALHLRTVNTILRSPDFWEFDQDVFPSYLKQKAKG
jgi:UDP-3-O-[3-hydroxymyristoyl] N-acetylglucosamine deacetylase